ncbi:MAG: hypothetical protein AABY64_04560 [Bdellovibrionota bacterium]
MATKEDFRQLRSEILQLEYRLTIKLGTIVMIGITALATIVTMVIKFT